MGDGQTNQIPDEEMTVSEKGELQPGTMPKESQELEAGSRHEFVFPELDFAYVSRGNYSRGYCHFLASFYPISLCFTTIFG
jgi:hypothetical protein